MSWGHGRVMPGPDGVSLDEIREIRAKPPGAGAGGLRPRGHVRQLLGPLPAVQLHDGAGRNRGACAQPCRYQYALVEEKRPGEFFPIEQDDRGTFIMNAKDMNMLAHLRELADAGVDSIKIEGRNKKASTWRASWVPIAACLMASCPMG